METALSGPEALERLAAEGDWEVLVSDYHMPGMNGLELLQEVKRRHPQVVRIMLTGYLDQDSLAEMEARVQAFRFLLKPCRPRELLEAIREALESRLPPEPGAGAGETPGPGKER